MAPKTNSRFRIRASALAVASCLSFVVCLPTADAAGLGRITLLSGLGQPLRAEVELVASRDEISGMTARVAAPETFRQAGLDYAAALGGVRLTIDRRAEGAPVIRVTSERPINDPFIDLLVELNWPAGRLVREYTFLLDPPEAGGKAAVAVAAPEAKGAVPRPTVAEPTRLARPAAAEPPEAARRPVATREVQRGETLRRIAGETRHEGVTLEQMIVGIFRANPDAFAGGNMNRLQAGKILDIPERPAVAAIPDAEAKRLFVTQAANFQDYRRKLAGLAAEAPAKPESQVQTTGGKITAKVEDKAAPVQSRDQLKISKTEAGVAGKVAGTGGRATEEDVVVKEKALREAQDRLASLEKNIAELQHLLAMKNQSLAEMQKQAAAKPETPSAAVPAIAPAPAQPVPAPIAVPTPAAPKPAAETPAPAVVPPAAQSVAKPAEPPKPAAPPQQAERPPAEPGFFDSLRESPLAVTGVGAVIALLGGLLLYRRRKQPVEKPAAQASESIGAATAVFGGTGGQSVDTSTTTVPHADFSQVGPGSIDADEVDAVAEADVYMAYGRDAQAEEILLEAMHRDPKRYAIHLKLLEIYARRKNVKQFESLASELYAQTGGAGPEWTRAAALGIEVDPTNPLFGGVAETVPRLEPELEIPPAIEPATEPAPSLPAFELPVEAEAVRQPPAEAAVATELPHLDFGLTPEAPERPGEASESATTAEVASLDFDLGPRKDVLAAVAAEVAATTRGTTPSAAEAPPAEAGNLIDFDLEGLKVQAPAATSPVAAPEADRGPAPLEVPPQAPTRTVDLAAIDLDLGAGAARELAEKMAGAQAPEPAVAAPVEAMISEDDPRFLEVATKLDLAKAYEEMGDLEGARELLREVAREGGASQREAAGLILARIGE